MGGKWIKFAALAIGTMLAGGASAQSEAPAKVGVTLPLSGPLSVNGRNYQNAMVLAEKKIKAEQRRPFEVIVYDDKGVTEEAVSAAKKLFSRDGVDALVSGAISGPALAQKEVSREAGKVHVIITAQHKDITMQGHSHLFRFNTTVEMGSRALLKYVVETIKPRSVWYLGVNDEYGRSVAAVYKESLEKSGIQLLGTEFYNSNDTDFLIYLARGKSAKPDLMLLAAPSDAVAATILKQKKQIGFDAPAAQAAGVLTKTLVDLAGGAAEGIVSVDSWVKTWIRLRTSGSWKTMRRTSVSRPASRRQLHSSRSCFLRRPSKGRLGN
ncbi:ABC transporter substrate-binding protein [Bradyrhizobium sp.]|uniref:ABC transporter substrate-binding protein n=1 Tax=Bradyrhizobium sp. TaxID=376 RepID=UPI001D9A66DF|nr:ABC transporter substrate-binding protein [Bradyrhizobium sp.]MBI5317891.1 ABC transporter substrate-binding protein [Bradyrhizobium sp.]